MTYWEYDLIYIDFSRLPENCTSYQQYISRIITGLKNDLIDAYPDYKLIPCVGTSYDKETKEHQCKIEMLSNHS